MVEFRVLGPFELCDDVGASVPLGRPKERLTLAFLLIRAGRVCSVEALIDGLWGEDPPASAVNLVQGYVSKLRRTLARVDGPAVQTSGAGYRLVLEGAAVDAHRFEALLDRARGLHGAPAAAAATLQDALGLWRGPVFADLEQAPFVTLEATRLGELRLGALEDRIEAELGCGRHAEVVAELASAVGEHPERERLWALQMLALYRCGRQADALAAFGDARRYLLEELGLDPGPELRRLEGAVLAQDPGLEWRPEAEPAVRTGNLARPLTSFVGRSRESDAVADLLDAHRLVTLTGAGGSGKTRLALEVAERVAPRWPEGAWVVDLAPISRGGDVTPAVATALGIRAEPGQDLAHTVASALTGRAMLVVLDNCEQVLAGAARLVEGLLHQGGPLTVLATSREPMRAAGERTWVVPPLAVPTRGNVAAADIEACEAVRLFLDRAGAALAGFVLTDEEAPFVARICRRLDGLPLALELAAARVAALPVAEIADRLDQRLLVTGEAAVPRQRTLEGSIDWSYRLLDEAEQRLFARLSVFAGGFGLDQVELLVPGAETLSLFSELVTKSLVLRVGAPHSGRYRLLEPLREFAAARLADHGEADETRARHADMFRVLAQEAAPNLFGPTAPGWLARLDEHVDNLRAALGYASGPQAADRATLPELAAALWFYWHLRGALAEGRAWLELAMAAVTDADSPLRAEILLGASAMALGLGAFDRAAEWSAEALAVATSCGDDGLACWGFSALGNIAWARGDLKGADRQFARSVEAGRPGRHWCACLAEAQRGRVARDQGDYRRAQEFIDRALGLARQSGFDMGVALAVDFAASLALARGGLDSAAALAQEALAHCRVIDYREGAASALQTIAAVASAQGRFDKALGAFAEGLLLCRQAGHLGGVAAGLDGIATVIADGEHRLDAARLILAADALRARIGAPRAPAEHVRRQDAENRLASELAAAAGEGQRPLEPAAAVALALAVATRAG